MDFSQIVKQLRLERGMTQQELANMVGLTKVTISQYETGKRKPSFEMIEALADVFHVDMNYLLGFTDKISRPSGDQTDDKIYNKYLAMTLEEINLISAYRHAGAETQAAIRAILHL
jgi:transcriptional regulator with XRE-family HTH domain|nr:MAG TPA: Repressor protein CI [Caudoviricetes sp.]